MEEIKTEVESIVEGICEVEKDIVDFHKKEEEKLSLLNSRINNLTLDELKELSNKLHSIKGTNITTDTQDLVDKKIAQTINSKKMNMNELAEKLVELSFASSNAYTQAVASEDRFERLERIEKAMQQMQFKESLAYEELLRNPRPLK
jgi:enoyl reductase-like protein